MIGGGDGRVLVAMGVAFGVDEAIVFITLAAKKQ